LGEVDSPSALTLQGVVVSTEMVNPHSFIHLEVGTGAAGRRERNRENCRQGKCGLDQ
jgi:hypothetical protein